MPRKFASVPIKALNYEAKVEYLIGYLPLYKEFAAMTDRPIAYLGRWMEELPEMHPDTIAVYGIKYLDYQDVHYHAHPECIDKESSMPLLRSALMLYDATGNRQYITQAENISYYRDTCKLPWHNVT